MIKKTISIILMLLVVVPSAFAGGMAVPAGERSEAYPYSFDAVWSASLDVLRGVPLDLADKAKGKIRTEKFNWQETEQKLFILTSVEDFQAQFFIFFKEVDSNKTVVKIFSRQETKKYSGQQGLRSSYRPSDGKQEELFLQALGKQLQQLKHE